MISFKRFGARVTHGDSMVLYPRWRAPACIMVDGPYGIGGYPGDPKSYDELPGFYEPHIKAWSGRAVPETTLWFWGTELGWATVHPLLKEAGWFYRALNVWDKGMGHVAGNVNTGTIRSFPVVSEVCAQYVRASKLELADGSLVFGGDWMRSEWIRTGLPMREANKACGVKDAATRKWLTKEEALWYAPPQDRYDALVAYANRHGAKDGRPYFSRELKIRRARFQCEFGVTNVWSVPQLSKADRQGHPNTKPHGLVKRIVSVSTVAGDMVWEPFGGTCPAARVTLELAGRESESAEVSVEFYESAKKSFSMLSQSTG